MCGVERMQENSVVMQASIMFLNMASEKIRRGNYLCLTASSMNLTRTQSSQFRQNKKFRKLKMISQNIQNL